MIVRLDSRTLHQAAEPVKPLPQPSLLDGAKPTENSTALPPCQAAVLGLMFIRRPHDAAVLRHAL